VRIAVVTGAGQGVGRGIALALAEAGFGVVIAARRAETGEPVAAEVRERGVHGICIETDVVDRAAVEAMVQQTVTELGRLDVMVHNAIKPPSPHRVETVGLDEWDELSQIAVWGSLFPFVVDPVTRVITRSGGGPPRRFRRTVVGQHT